MMSRNVRPVLDLEQRLRPGHAHARAEAAVELDHDGLVERRVGRARAARRRPGSSATGSMSASGSIAATRRPRAAVVGARTSRSRRRRRPPARIFSTLVLPIRRMHGRTLPSARPSAGTAPARRVSASISTPERRELEPRDLAVDRLRAPGARPAPSARRARTRCSTASAWSAKDMSITAAGWPSAGGEVDDAAARRAGSAAGRRASYCSTSGSTSRTRRPRRRAASARSISTSKWPGVGEHGAVLHALEVLAAQHVARCR